VLFRSRATIGAAGTILGTGSLLNSGSPLMQYLYNMSVYQAGLSGGAWFVGANLYQDILIQALIDELILRMSTATGGILNEFQSNCEYACKLWCDRYLGYQCLSYPSDPTSAFLGTWWSGGIANKLLVDQNGIEKVFKTKLSDIRNFASFQSYKYPFPIIAAIQNLTDYNVPGDAYQFEFTPFTVGSLNTDSKGYIDTKFFNSKFTAGAPQQSCNGASCCWQGDTLPFLMGLSSSAFNIEKEFVPYICGLRTGPEYTACENLLTAWAELCTLYCPNNNCGGTVSNFLYDFVSDTSALKTLPDLHLVDGGFGGNVPFAPLLSADRGVTDIFAFDNSADVNNFPDGEVLIFASQWASKNSRPFPVIPDDILTQNKTIFVFNGCRRGTGADQPAVFYIPSGPYPEPYNIPTVYTLTGMDETALNVLSRDTSKLVGSNYDFQQLLTCLWQNRYPDVGKPSSACNCTNGWIKCFDASGTVVTDACPATPTPPANPPANLSGSYHSLNFSATLFIFSLFFILFKHI